jgi:hypothetical protein
MEKSPSIENLAKALVSFQTEMQTVVYDADNPFYKSKYATLAALVKDSKDLLAKNGLAVSQLCEGDCAVTTILMHISGEHMIARLELKPVQDTPQGRGACITYSRRYSYASILGLVSDKDDDGNEASGVKAEPKAVDHAVLLPTMKERCIAEGRKKFKTPDEFQAWRVDHKLVESISNATEVELSYLWAVLREKK